MAFWGWCGKVVVVRRDILRKAISQISRTLLFEDDDSEPRESEVKVLRSLIVLLRQSFGDDMFAPEKTGAASNVLFALNPETSPWAESGVHDELGQIIWDLYGFDPSQAKVWIDAGLSCDDAHAWSSHSVDYSLDRISRGWTPSQGREWSSCDPEKAQRWIDAGGTFAMERDWGSHGPQAVPYLKQLHDWKGKYWSMPNENKYAELWKDISLADAVNFIPKGYTYRSARKALTKGLTSQTAPAYRGTELIPGKTFKGLIEVAAPGWNYPLLPDDVEGLDENPILETRFYNSEHRRDIVVIFAASGRFVAAEDVSHSFVREKTLRSVSEVSEILKFPQYRSSRGSRRR